MRSPSTSKPCCINLRSALFEIAVVEQLVAEFGEQIERIDVEAGSVCRPNVSTRNAAIRRLACDGTDVTP